MAPGPAGRGLVGWWTFDGKDMINNVADRSGMWNTGMLKFGTLGNTSTSSMVVDGKIGQGLLIPLSSATQMVTLASNVPAVATNTFTISAWVKPTATTRSYNTIIAYRLVFIVCII